MDTDIVTVFSVRVTSSPDGIEAQHTTDSTTMNVCLHCYDAPALPDIVFCADCLKIYQDEYEASLQSCSLCEQPARHIYHTTSFTWKGRDWPSERRPLCDLHMQNACELIVESVDVRDEAERQYEALQDERGQVA